MPGMQETQVQSLGREDPLKEMATHSSTLAWRIYSPWGCKESDTTERLDFTSLSRPSERYCPSRSKMRGVALLPAAVSRVDIPTPSVSQPPDSACPSSWCLLGQDPCGQRGACMIT